MSETKPTNSRMEREKRQSTGAAEKIFDEEWGETLSDLVLDDKEKRYKFIRSTCCGFAREYAGHSNQAESDIKNLKLKNRILFFEMQEQLKKIQELISENATLKAATHAENLSVNISDEGTELPELHKGDKIKLYGRKTTVEGFTAQWNDAFDKYEIIIHTTGRGDPFRRSMDVIEIIEPKPGRQNS